jgi:hypothetical protein
MIDSPTRRFAIPPLSLSGVAVICTLLTIFALGARPVTDPDFWWHLASGKYMVANHLIPRHDVFSLTARDHRWITHEWLTEVLFYGGWLLGGARLLSLATGAVIALTFWVVFRACAERGARISISAPLVGLAAFSSAHTWGTRPQMISMLLTALFGLALSRMLVRGLPAPSFWLPVLMVLWVNLHGGFIFGVALVAIAAAGHVIQDRFRISRVRDEALPPTMPRVDVGRTALVVGLTAFATLLNPNGLAGALYPFSYLGNNASTQFITEWVSPDFHRLEFLYFEAMVLLLIVGAMASPYRARLADVVVLLPFLYLSFNSVRNISLLAVLAAPVIAELLTSALPPPRPARSLHPRRSLANGLCVTIIGLGLLGLAFVDVGPDAQARAVTKDFPVGALQYVKTHGLPSRGFDSYNWGGFLIWNWYGTRSVYVDGRPDMYGNAFMDEYIQAYRGGGSWAGLLDANRLCYVLVEPNTGIARALSTAPGWRLTYGDSVAVLYLRRGRFKGCGP